MPLAFRLLLAVAGVFAACVAVVALAIWFRDANEGNHEHDPRMGDRG